MIARQPAEYSYTVSYQVLYTPNSFVHRTIDVLSSSPESRGRDDLATLEYKVRTRSSKNLLGRTWLLIMQTRSVLILRASEGAGWKVMRRGDEDFRVISVANQIIEIPPVQVTFFSLVRIYPRVHLVQFHMT